MPDTCRVGMRRGGGEAAHRRRICLGAAAGRALHLVTLSLTHAKDQYSSWADGGLRWLYGELWLPDGK